MKLEDWQGQGNTFRFQGHDIFYRVEGSGPPLLCLHGFPTSSWDWQRLWPVLTQHFQCIAPDLLGFGFSDKPRGHRYSLFEQCDLVEGLCLELGIPKLRILAHDYSDTIVQELSARAIEGSARVQVQRAVMLNGGILYGSYRPRPMQKLLLSPLGKVIGPLMGEKQFRRSFSQIFGPDTAPSQDELADWWKTIAHNEGARVVHDVIQYQKERKQFQVRWRNALRDCPFPLHLVIGDADPISGILIAREYEALCQRKVDLLPGIGHYPQTEAPEATLAHILPFLRAET